MIMKATISYCFDQNNSQKDMLEKAIWKAGLQ